MVLFTAIAVLSTVTILFILFSKWRYQYWTRKGVAQLEPQLIFGNYKPLIKGSVSGQTFFLDFYKKARAMGVKHIGVYNFLSPEFMPVDLNLIKRILVKDFDSFSGHGLYAHEKEPLTMHLFAMEGEEWKKRRAKLSPTFTSGKMKMMFDAVIEKVNVLKKVVGEHAESDKTIKTKETLARFGTDVIGSVAFGIECNSLQETNNKFRDIGKQAFASSLLKYMLMTMFPHKLLGKLGFRNIPAEVSTYFTKVVKDTIRYREENNVQRKDFMQLMVQLKNQGDKGLFISEQEIITESYLFYLAGFETTSSATTFALLELAYNQDIQDKLRQEINDTLKEHEGQITYDAVMQMEYLDKVIHETLRKYPALAIIPRVCGKTYKIPDSDIVIEKGTVIHIPAWGIHKDPEYYPNPEEFNPENFSHENKAKRPDFTFLPFGEGPRICIGLRFGLMQSKIALITLLKEYIFSPHENTQFPVELENGSVVMMAKGELCITVNKL